MNGCIVALFAGTILLGYLSEDVRAMEYCTDYDGSRVERGKMFSMGINPCTTCVCGPDGKPIECDEMKCHVPHLPAISPPPFRKPPPEHRRHFHAGTMRPLHAGTMRPLHAGTMRPLHAGTMRPLNHRTFGRHHHAADTIH